VSAAAVVGGGIGGLAAARALQLAGWSVQVLEKAERLDPLGAGISLGPNAIRALTVLDVPLRASGDHGGAPDDSRGAAAGGGATAGGGVRTSRGRWLLRTDPWTYPARYGAALVAVHRADLQQALLDCLRRTLCRPAPRCPCRAASGRGAGAAQPGRGVRLMPLTESPQCCSPKFPTLWRWLG